MMYALIMYFYADDLCLMAPCAIALQELINACYQYSNEIDLKFNATKSFCVAFTPKHYKLLLPSLFMNSLSILYVDSIKYLGIFTSNNCDNSDILKQMRMLYCRSNCLVRLFNKCSKPVLLELCRSFCTVFYSPYFWTQYKKTTFSKIRVAYIKYRDVYVTMYIGKYWEIQIQIQMFYST